MPKMEEKVSSKKHNHWVNPSFSDLLGDNLPTCGKKRSCQALASRSEKKKPQKRKGEPDSGCQDQDEPWVQRYAARSKAELAVHKKKVQEVEHWLRLHSKTSQGGLLLLTGPSGCGKTATVQVLCAELGLRIQEWTNPTSEDSHSQHGLLYSPLDWNMNSSSQSAQFQEFLLRANKYTCLKMVGDVRPPGMKVILVEEFPNHFYRQPGSLHDVLRTFVKSSGCPVVFIVSDSLSGDSSSRLLFPRELLEELHITCISFNPVAPTSMMKVLTHIATLQKTSRLDQAVLEQLCSGSSGDVRSAINSLQFSSISDGGLQRDRPLTSQKKVSFKSGQKKKFRSSQVKEEEQSVGMKDACLFLFRALGKILHCKRASPECAERASLPAHLCHHHREPLQLDPELVVERSHVSGDFFNLYLHQNYLDFFSNIEDVDRASEYLSDADLLTSDWTSRSVLEAYASSVATRGLLHSNCQQAAVGFRPLHKPHWLLVSKMHREKCLLAQCLFSSMCVTPVSLHTHLLPYLAKLTNPLRSQDFVLMMQELHEAVSLDDDMNDGDLGDGTTFLGDGTTFLGDGTTFLGGGTTFLGGGTTFLGGGTTFLGGGTTFLSSRRKKQPSGETSCLPKVMIPAGWEKKVPAESMMDMSNQELQDRLQASGQMIDALISELDVARRYLKGKFAALKILQGKAILDRATSHTQSLLHKSEERAKALETEVNSLQWELSFKQLQMKKNEQSWEQKYCIMLSEKKTLADKLEERDREVERLQVENSVLRLHECSEIVSMLKVTEQNTHLRNKDQFWPERNVSLLEPAVQREACRCHCCTEPCPCMQGRTCQKKLLQLQQELEAERWRREEASMVSDAFRIAFEQQMKNRSDNLMMFTQNNFLKSSSGGVSENLRHFLPSHKEAKMSAALPDALYELLDLLSDKEEALAHQRKVSTMLAHQLEKMHQVKKPSEEDHSKHGLLS
ncbi:cell cycle checkpoint protein RAD17-like [Nerophis ophidion]|uniref:cell cycle checkpoint protein RAD17-like n=1 Tax=Nerophis ophidion TaxID=159077 RepID=UPI002ADFEBE6|nr:cell cycle checkpoint protein RAD17-like [Nerophis ophidion]